MRDQDQGYEVMRNLRIKVMSIKNVKNVEVAKLEFSWTLGASPYHKKPRYIIIGFQVDSYDNYEKAAIFNHCDVRRITVTLNSESTPTSRLSTTSRMENMQKPIISLSSSEKATITWVTTVTIS